MLNSPAYGTNVSLPLDCKSFLWPLACLVEDLFTNHANGPGSPPALVPSVGQFNIFEMGPPYFQRKKMKCKFNLNLSL